MAVAWRQAVQAAKGSSRDTLLNCRNYTAVHTRADGMRFYSTMPSSSAAAYNVHLFFHLKTAQQLLWLFSQVGFSA
jgi:hypothetical protein